MEFNTSALKDAQAAVAERASYASAASALIDGKGVIAPTVEATVAAPALQNGLEL